MPRGTTEKSQANSEANNHSQNHQYAWIALVVIAFLYVVTAPHKVTFEDAGLFLTTSFDWGVPHPPGYPLYTFLVHFLMKVSPFSPAFTSALFSILCGVGSCYVAYKLFLAYEFTRKLAATGVLAVGLGQVYWNQMIVPEVYALHILLFALMWFFSVQCARLPSAQNSLLMWICFGLSMANHWPLVILSGPIIVVTVWPVRNMLVRYWSHLIVGLAVAFGAYYMMYLRSQSGAQYMFLGPIQNLGDLLGYINRNYYKLSDSQAPFRLVESIKFIAAFTVDQLFVQLSPLIAPLVLFGAYNYFQEKRPHFFLLMYGIFSIPVILAVTLHFEFNELNFNVFRVFHLVPHICFVILALQGFKVLWAAGKKWAQWILAGALAISAAAGLVVNNFQGDDLADGYARLILESLPKNAVLFAATDADVGPVSYVNVVEGYRSDVKLMTQTGVFYPDKLFDPYEFGRNFRARSTKEFLIKKAPTFSTKKFDILDKEKDLPLSFKYNGIYYLVDTTFSSEAPKTQAMIDAADRLAANQLKRSWLFNWPYHRNVVMSRLCNLLVLNGREKHAAFEENRSCRLVFAKHLRATKRYQESMAVVQDLIDHHSRWLVGTERIDLYNVNLLNSLDWANTGVSGGEQRLDYVRRAVDVATDSFDDYDGCDHPVYEIIKSIQPEPGWTPKTLDRLKKFSGCSKTSNPPSKG